MKLSIILIAALLAACGGSSHTTESTAPVEQAQPVTPVGPHPTLPGYQEDGTLSPVDTKPCHEPQASDTGIEHGKPPVGRCA